MATQKHPCMAHELERYLAYHVLCTSHIAAQGTKTKDYKIQHLRKNLVVCGLNCTTIIARQRCSNLIYLPV